MPYNGFLKNIFGSRVRVMDNDSVDLDDVVEYISKPIENGAEIDFGEAYLSNIDSVSERMPDAAEKMSDRIMQRLPK